MVPILGVSYVVRSHIQHNHFLDEKFWEFFFMTVRCQICSLLVLCLKYLPVLSMCIIHHVSIWLRNLFDRILSFENIEFTKNFKPHFPQAFLIINFYNIILSALEWVLRTRVPHFHILSFWVFTIFTKVTHSVFLSQICVRMKWFQMLALS